MSSLRLNELALALLQSLDFNQVHMSLGKLPFSRPDSPVHSVPALIKFCIPKQRITSLRLNELALALLTQLKDLFSSPVDTCSQVSWEVVDSSTRVPIVVRAARPTYYAGRDLCMSTLSY
eukprot:1150727-Pelagomonas_calceolata.AAC.3